MYDGLGTNSPAHTHPIFRIASRSRAIATAAFEFLFQHFLKQIPTTPLSGIASGSSGSDKENTTRQVFDDHQFI